MQTVTMEGFEEVVFGDPLNCDGERKGLWARLNGRWYKINSNPSIIPSNFPLSPGTINDPHKQIGRFGRFECEQFASSLLRYAQRRGDWIALTVDDLQSFEPSSYNVENLQFFAKLGFLVQKDGTYYYTFGFVTELWEFSHRYDDLRK